MITGKEIHKCGKLFVQIFYNDLFLSLSVTFSSSCHYDSLENPMPRDLELHQLTTICNAFSLLSLLPLTLLCFLYQRIHLIPLNWTNRTCSGFLLICHPKSQKVLYNTGLCLHCNVFLLAHVRRTCKCLAT